MSYQKINLLYSVSAESKSERNAQYKANFKNTLLRIFLLLGYLGYLHDILTKYIYVYVIC